VASDRKHRKADQGSQSSEELTTQAEDDASELADGAAEDLGEASADVSYRGIPRWRQIEIMREKRELRQMLAEIGDEDIDIDEEIFGVDENPDEIITLLDDDPEDEPGSDPDGMEFEELYDD